MASFSYNTAAELFPPRSARRSGRVLRIAASTPRPPRCSLRSRNCRRNSLNGAYLQVDEARFDQSGIRTLYESQDFPLPRRPRAPEPEPASNDADADAA